MRHSRTIATLTLLAFTAPALAEVYRCESGGVIEFSDRPCSADSQPHRSTRGISLVPADEALPRLAAENRRFVEQRRQALAAKRRAATEASQAPSPAEEVRTVWLPVPARHAPPRRPIQPEQAPRQPRFSALSGPILGTRNRERWEDPEPRSERGRQ